MNIYPAPKGIEKIRESNPAYWALCISRSQYSADEVNSTLDKIIETNLKIQEFKSFAYDLIEGMGYIEGFDSDAHKELSIRLSSGLYYLNANMSENSHTNCFPVTKWLKEIKQAERELENIKKFISINFNAA